MLIYSFCRHCLEPRLRYSCKSIYLFLYLFWFTNKLSRSAKNIFSLLTRIYLTALAVNNNNALHAWNIYSINISKYIFCIVYVVYQPASLNGPAKYAMSLNSFMLASLLIWYLTKCYHGHWKILEMDMRKEITYSFIPFLNNSYNYNYISMFSA